MVGNPSTKNTHFLGTTFVGPEPEANNQVNTIQYKCFVNHDAQYIEQNN